MSAEVTTIEAPAPVAPEAPTLSAQSVSVQAPAPAAVPKKTVRELHKELRDKHKAVAKELRASGKKGVERSTLVDEKRAEIAVVRKEYFKAIHDTLKAQMTAMKNDPKLKIQFKKAEVQAKKNEVKSVKDQHKLKALELAKKRRGIAQ